MSSKILFVVFSEEPCRRNHAFRYALDLHRKGHVPRIILEGAATGSLRELSDPSSDFASLFLEAERLGLIAGACRAASHGCKSEDESRNVVRVAESRGIALLDEADGHASLEPFVREGYQVVVF